MLKFRTLLLLSISLLILSSGCSIKPYKSLLKTDSAPELQNPFEQKQSFIYKSNALLYGEKVSGILAIKQMPDSSFRTILTSYMGLKFFDFGFDGEAFTVHNIMDKMNRSILIDLIKNDFQLMLMTTVENDQLESFQNPDTKEFIFNTKEGKHTRYYIANEEGQLQRIELFKGRKKKVEVLFSKYRLNSASDIHLKHLDKKIDIQLSLLK